MKKNIRQYHIDSFERLCNVINSKNFEALTTDLILWLGYHVELMDKIRKAFPERANEPNWQLAKTTFIWNDDGKREMKEIIIRNEETGEVTTYSLKPKKKP